jgi:hypothetical protein
VNSERIEKKKIKRYKEITADKKSGWWWLKEGSSVNQTDNPPAYLGNVITPSLSQQSGSSAYVIGASAQTTHSFGRKVTHNCERQV